METGFDSGLYMSRQTEHILERIGRFHNKLYLEFGGKLFDDYHAARVLPGFDVNAKVKLLEQLRDRAEILFCIHADAIGAGKIRADFGIPYDMDCLRLMDRLRERGLYINGVVITQYRGQPAADAFMQMLSLRGTRIYKHYPITGYPADIDAILSDQGYGRNDYVETTRPLVVVTAPGPNSGKLATCLSQLYHEHRRGIQAGYAKFETFPIWNLPLRHPVNVAYEAATADLKDINMIDPFHLEAYGSTTVNYNRDVEVFPVVRAILGRITGADTPYQSPTDMGVNMAGLCITDDEIVSRAARQEVLRRCYWARCDHARGQADEQTAQRAELLIRQLNLTPADRAVVAPALLKAEQSGAAAMALDLGDGAMVTGRASPLLGAAAALLLNAVKRLAGIRDNIPLLSPVILEPILSMKKQYLGRSQPALTLEEALIALSICAATNTMAELAISQVPALTGCEAHASCLPGRDDEQTLRRLGVRLTCEPVFPTNDLYQP